MSLITLTNKSIGPVNWEDKALCDHDLDSRVHIWQIDISDHLPCIDELKSVLTPDEIKRANRYIRSEHCDRFIISRSSLRYILAGYLKCGPEAIQFKLTANKKPEIDVAGTPIHFNLSDSADRVLIAVAYSPVGIDVEFVNHKFSYRSILHNNFSLTEADFIEQNDSYNRFFLLWTRKEAILKATGIGLTDHLKLITALDGEYVMEGSLLSTHDNWHLSSTGLDGGYIATIATHLLKKNHRFFNFK